MRSLADGDKWEGRVYIPEEGALIYCVSVRCAVEDREGDK
jgi:hypothetical protein